LTGTGKNPEFPFGCREKLEDAKSVRGLWDRIKQEVSRREQGRSLEKAEMGLK
jgi:hypothetical protein